MAEIAPRYKTDILTAAAKYGVDPALLAAQIGRESGFNPNAVSPAGAKGISQFMPGTAKGFGIDPMNPDQSINAQGLMMSRLLKSYGGNKALALAAYNAGAGAVAAAGGKVPQIAETQNYVKNILADIAQGKYPGLVAAGKTGQLPLPDGTPSTVPASAPVRPPQAPVALAKVPGPTPGGLTAGSFLTAALQTLGQQRNSSVQGVEQQSMLPLPGGAVSTVPVNAVAPPTGVVNPTTGVPPGNSSPASKGTPGYVSPFSQASGLRMERTDQGVDAVVTPGSKITAMTDGVVAGIIPNWYKGQPMVYTKVTSGPRKGQYIYYSEGITPNVKVGDTFKAGQPIATATNQPTGMEFGFAKADGSVLTPYGKSPDGTATPGGKAFAQFLNQLRTKGGPRG